MPAVFTAVLLVVLQAVPTMSSVALDLRAYRCGSGFTSEGGKHIVRSVKRPEGDTSNPTYLYWAAMSCKDLQKALDTMRMFVEGHANLFLAQDGLSKTLDFTAQIKPTSKQLWINEYNWLASVYTLNTQPDTTIGVRYREQIIAGMAECAYYFDHNLKANLWYNDMILFPEDSGADWRTIQQIRGMQKLIPEDTTPWWRIPIPPPTYTSFVAHGHTISSLDYSVAPNPVDRTLHVDIESPYSTGAILELFDELGRSVRVLSTDRISGGDNLLTLDVSDIRAGSYYLRLSAGGTVKTIELSI